MAREAAASVEETCDETAGYDSHCLQVEDCESASDRAVGKPHDPQQVAQLLLGLVPCMRRSKDQLVGLAHRTRKMVSKRQRRGDNRALTMVVRSKKTLALFLFVAFPLNGLLKFKLREKIV